MLSSLFFSKSNSIIFVVSCYLYLNRWNEALEIDGNDVGLLDMKAQSLIHLHEWIPAIQACQQAIKVQVCWDRLNTGREGTLGCLLYQSLKFYNNVFLFVGLTTLGTFIEC